MSLSLYTRDKANGGGTIVRLNGGSGDGLVIERAVVSPSGIGSYVDVTPVGAVTDVSYTITGTGYYYWRVRITAGPPYEYFYSFQPATADGDSPWMRAITATMDRIQAVYDEFEWESWLTGGVQFLFNPKVDEAGSPIGFTLPCILITITGETETIENKTNQQEDTGYPVVISLVEKKHEDSETHRARLIRARWLISRALHGPRWDLRVWENYEVEVRPSEVLVPSWLSESAIRWSLMTAFWKCREIRRPPGTGG